MKTLILILISITLTVSCKKETPEPIQPTFCWECYSYVTTIDTLHNYSFQAHFESDTLCNKTETEINLINSNVTYQDTFVLSPGINYVCFRIYVTICKKQIKL